MTLYYAPGGCSISPHIALREAKLPFQLQRVDFMRGKKLDDGTDFVTVNPKGYIPALALENGQLLTETAVMVQYIADLRPESKLAPAPGTFERVRLQEWLNFIATELHKGLTPFYSPDASEQYKTKMRERFELRLGVVGNAVEAQPYLMGEQFTVADGYAFYTLRAWQTFVKGELKGALVPYYARLLERPSIQAALEAEGFTKDA
ncbi:glutathione transferase GstA [Labilithrix luteola]|uniref:glutathione transferase GstA n=1 Tax=Labilithrix luteola TaxID=1391654 RepID=UPI0011BA6F27